MQVCINKMVKFKQQIMYVTLQELKGVLPNSWQGQIVPKDSIIGINALRKLGYKADDVKAVARKVTEEDYKNPELTPWLLDTDLVEEKLKATRSVFMLNNYMDNIVVFQKKQPFFYDKAGLFWFWNNNEYKWEIVDEVDVMNSIDYNLELYGQTITSGIKSSYMEAFKRVGRLNIPEDSPKTWIQFKDKVFDIKTKETFQATHKYFVCNPIPWEIGDSDETPVMDKLFSEWVGVKYVETLYEIIAYSTLPDYPIHMICCFIGVGRNGKSKFLTLLQRFIGLENTTSTELDLLLESRFESAKLYKKLVCCLGETNFGIISKTSLLKKLTGQDVIGYEMKNKKPFDDFNYAKIMISSNSLPSSEDTSEGFYRRWLIINFPNKFPEGKDILETIPNYEYNNLSNKICNILPGLVERGQFSKQGTIKERKDKYILSSNPINIFIDKFCEQGHDKFIRYSELYSIYIIFLKVIERRTISKREFTKNLDGEGIEIRRTSRLVGDTWNSDRWVEGLCLHSGFMSLMSLITKSSTLSLYIESKWKHCDKCHNCHRLAEMLDCNLVPQEMKVKIRGELELTKELEQKPKGLNTSSEKWDEKCLVYQQCCMPLDGENKCGDTPCNEFDGKNYCKYHFEKIQMEEVIE